MEIFDELNLFGELCFDVGANVGNKTQKFLNFGASSVVCIEPQKKCISVLESKFSGDERIKIVGSALGKEDSTEVIYISDSNTLSTMSKEFISETTKYRFVDKNWEEEEFVNVTTLDSLINLYGTPKYCKIDVEGYESNVLLGLTIPIEYISIEFVPELKEKTFECISIINNISKYVFNYVEGESDNFTFNNWISSEKMVDFLKQNNDFRISFGDLYAKLV